MAIGLFHGPNRHILLETVNMSKKLTDEIVNRLKGKKSEPSIDIQTDFQLVRALSQYNLEYEKEDARQWLIVYCEQNSMNNLASAIKSRAYQYPASLSTLGFCCRLAMRGCKFIDPSILHTKLRAIKIIKKQEQPKPVKFARVNPLGISYDIAYDATMTTGKPQKFALAGLAGDIAEVLKQANSDLDDVKNYPDEYDNATTLTKFLESVIGQKPIKKQVVRIAKPKPPAKLVAKLRYQKTFAELGLTSIDPEKIIGASELFVYDTASRTLSLFVSKTRLSVDGINIVNYDEEKSFAVTIRKPEQLFAVKPNHRSMTSAMKTIKSVRRPVRKRLAATTILLSVKNSS